MTAESREAEIDLKAVLSEMFPYRHYDNVKIDDHILAAIVLIRREIVMLQRPVPKQLPPGYAEGAEPQRTARIKGRQKGRSE